MGRPSEDREPVEVLIDDVKRETRDAKLFDTVDHGEVWIPISVIEDETDSTVTVKRWFAEKKGLL